MPIPLTITNASQTDLPTLISICCEAVQPDPITRFLYGSREGPAIQAQTESLTFSLGARFTHPTNQCYILKAVNEKEEIVGWILVRWEEGHVAPPESEAEKEKEKGNFVAWYSRQVKMNWVKLLPKTPHVVIGALYVRPDQQGMGIGRQLVEFIYAKYELEKELVIVQTRAVSEGFYVKLGWVTVDCTEVDLSEWAGTGMGFGWHRSPQMMRYPEEGNGSRHSVSGTS